MSILDMVFARKREVLQTDEIRRKTRSDISNTKAELNEKFAALSELVDQTLTDLKDRKGRSPSRQ